MKTPRVTRVREEEPYILELDFEDGQHRCVDMAGLLDGKMFEPLQDPEFFALASIDPVWHTVCWPNGADLAPEWLYEPDPEKYWKMTDARI